MDSTTKPLPPCGLYKTMEPIAEIPEGRLVYFHNHGDPGPGIYLPSEWRANRAQFNDRGTLLPSPELVRALRPLAREGLYRVCEAFYCCEKRCVEFEQDTLVQLGYNGQAEPIVFTPELSGNGMAFPEQGTRIDEAHIPKLQVLKVRRHERQSTNSAPEVLH